MEDFSNIDNIVFDLGGVIINIDFDLTTQAMANLGGISFEEAQQRMESFAFYDIYEKGQLSDAGFRDLVRKALKVDAGDSAVDDAWNALLLDIPVERITMIKELRKKYKVFLLSNTSNIHVLGVNEILEKSTGHKSLDELFDKVYLSYEMGLRKPGVEIYQTLAKDAGLDPSRTLFIDDNKANALGASEAGWYHIHLQHPLTILDYFKDA